jgi:hypothetical protein
MTTRYLRSALFCATTLCALATTASAQTDPPPASSPPPTMSSRSSSGAHGPWGFGGIAYLSGTAGLSVAFDPGPFHVDTILAFAGGDNQNTEMQFGGRFWFVLHSTSNADFSVGGGLSVRHLNPPGNMPNTTQLFFEGGAQTRIFLASNVALGFATGIAIATNDASGYAVGATNLFGDASLHYFF